MAADDVIRKSKIRLFFFFVATCVYPSVPFYSKGLPMKLVFFFGNFLTSYLPYFLVSGSLKTHISKEKQKYGYFGSLDVVFWFSVFPTKF